MNKHHQDSSRPDPIQSIQTSQTSLGIRTPTPVRTTPDALKQWTPQASATNVVGVQALEQTPPQTFKHSIGRTMRTNTPRRQA
jgi:hypothetical protein